MDASILSILQLSIFPLAIANDVLTVSSVIAPVAIDTRPAILIIEDLPLMFGKLSARYAPTVPRLPLPCGILLVKFGRLNVVFPSRDFAFTKISNCYRI